MDMIGMEWCEVETDIVQNIARIRLLQEYKGGVVFAPLMVPLRMRKVDFGPPQLEFLKLYSSMGICGCIALPLFIESEE